MRILFHFLTLVTLVTLTGCDGADGADHLTALVYSDLSQPSASKFQTSPANFTDLSFCFWLNLKNLRTSKLFDHQPKNKQGFGFTLQKDYGFLNLKNVDLLFDYNFFHVPNRWRHFCVVYESAKEDFKIFADGRLTFEKNNLQVVAGQRFQDNLLSGITLGNSKPDSKSFNGEFTGFFVWSRALNDEEPRQYFGCAKVDSTGLVLDWSKTGIFRGENVMMTSLETLCPAHLNDDKHTIVGFEDKKMFPDYVSLCRGLGATELVPSSQEDLKMIIDSFEDFSGNCNNKFWVPVRQRKGRWMSEEQREVDYLPWYPGQPNGGRHQHCTEAKIDPSQDLDIAHYEGYNDLNCAVSTRCFYCNLKSPQRFTLRGLCPESKIDSDFIGNFQHFIEGKRRPKFVGYTNHEISFSESSLTWELVQVTTRETLASYNGSKLWPTGRNTWHVSRGVCGNFYYDQDLILSSCEDGEFTCPDGTCLPVSRVCDGQPQCEDEADERGCDLVQFPTSSQYIPSLPPVPGDSSPPAPVNISVDIINIANVKETSLQWTVKLELQMDWHDPRLDWRNLRGEQNLNIIPLQDPLEALRSGSGLGSGQVWVPLVMFLNTPATDMSLLDTQTALTVARQGELTMSSLDTLDQVAIYKGSENPLNYKRKYTKIFACDIHLRTYPFDTQRCKIKLGLASSLQGLVSLQASDLSFSGPKEMMQYSVVHWQIKDTQDGVEVLVDLKRQYQHHLFNTYIPTLGLMLICQTTLYFNKEHFKTNVPVTITTMLVMYTLYMAVSNKLPPTSYIKFIDVWLIFGLTLPFTVFFLHFLIEHIPSRHQDPDTEERLVKVKRGLVTFAKMVMPCIILTFATVYLSVAVYLYLN